MKVPEVWECPECGRLFDSESVCMPSGARTVLRERGGEVVSAVLNRNRYRGHPPEVVHGLALELGDDGSVTAHRPGMEPVDLAPPDPESETP